MKRKIITASDKQLLFLKKCKIGIHYLVTTENKFDISPHKSKFIDNDLFDNEFNDLLFDSHEQPANEINGGKFKSSFQLDDYSFKTYISDAGPLICHYVEFDGFKMMQEILVASFNVDVDFLNTCKSTNQKNDFIPIEIVRKLGPQKIKKVSQLLYGLVVTKLEKLANELQEILRIYYPEELFMLLDYFKLSNIELALDFESPGGVDLGSRIEIHQNLAPHIVKSSSGHYIDRHHNTVSPWASTELKQCDRFPPYFWGKLKDKTEVNIYLKYKSKAAHTGWMQRFERKFLYEQNFSGANKISSVLNKNLKRGERIQRPTFSTWQDLESLISVLNDDTFEILNPSLNIPIIRSIEEIRDHIGDVLQSYCPQNSLELHRRLCFPPWSMPASMIDKQDGFPRGRIKALEKEGIIRKKNNNFYELNLSYFKAAHLKK